jgi:hypothetical protein
MSGRESTNVPAYEQQFATGFTVPKPPSELEIPQEEDQIGSTVGSPRTPARI